MTITSASTARPGWRRKTRWEAGGFLPHLPESPEQLDLLLLTVTKARKVRQDGIHFQGLRYLDLTLAAYVGEWVTIRYDPQDMAEIRVYHDGRFLCRAVCQELAGETISLKEVIRARDCAPPRTARDARRSRRAARPVARRPTPPPPVETPQPPPAAPPRPTRLKRYLNE